MLHYIENESYRVGVESLGAELQHFIKLDENLELIWGGDSSVWAGHAPNLFPIVGELPQQQYTCQGKTYHMLRHGFARRKEFKLVEEGKNKLVFELQHDEQTLEQYPFKFNLFIAYTLEGNRLATVYQVTNTDDHAMLFSIGGHPGFNVPLYPNEQYNDYYIEFEKAETLNRYLLDNAGLQTGETEIMLTDNTILPLRHEYFDKDAIVLKDLHSQKVRLASKTGPRSIEVNFEGFPYLGIWTKPGDAPFVCIEPWCGIASRASDTGELEEKEGMIKLAPSQIFERSYIFTVN
ncbi:aldose 1-epimerase family protein [Pontibacter harenae]|uniref:aldose 1-epimerase family protein n=1 Tax=Pontibacter harenae TaxID=2894083 RepID=UPI001E35F71A|nr:aldose 1-epimerase family protein [Pontibacter harenae]MCC9165948.1 aldose 1-epimerase family protein [Pontibacter harenae]